MNFYLFNCFLSDHPHCEDAEHFFRECSAGKTNHFFGGKIRSTTRGSVNGGKNWHFLQELLAQNPLDFIFFPLLKTTFSSRRPLGSHAWSCQFFCLEPFLQHQPTTSNSCCEEKPVAHRCSAPPVALVDFAISRFVVWLFCPDNYSLEFYSFNSNKLEGVSVTGGLMQRFRRVIQGQREGCGGARPPNQLHLGKFPQSGISALHSGNLILKT